ncbi:MAG: CAAD domain-containing protein [Cyanobacteria bacterium]|nr:CAAD domain-containing protein [Cyanobacteriota bacterium]
MAEIPEIPVVPAEAPPAEAAAPHPDPSGESLGGAQPAEVTNQSSWVDSGSPAVVGSYATPAPSAAAEAPAPEEAAPAVFVAGYGSALSEPPGIATSIVVPPLPVGEAGDGGEWDLLRSKVSTWFDGADLQGRWESLGGPLRAAGLLLAAVVLLRLYSALLETLGDLPLVPRLLQLVGLLTVARFALTKLVRSSERERILTSWNQRWNDFRGRD